MATRFPEFDDFDPEFQQRRDDAEHRAFGDSGGVATDEALSPVYLDAFDRPRVCAMMHDVLIDSRWGLGDTMVGVADFLGTDHSVISRACHWGVIPRSLENYLTALPSRPDDWERPIREVLDARHRAGFMAVAKYLAGRMQEGVWPKQSHLIELHAELLFEVLKDRKGWSTARDNPDTAAARIISLVCDDPQREVLPFWYTKKRRRLTRKLISRLQKDSRFAFRYLSLLQSRWESSFVLAWAATEERRRMVWQRPRKPKSRSSRIDRMHRGRGFLAAS